MERFAVELKKIKENLRGCRDDEIRRKARALILIMESTASVRLACDKLGMVPKTFYVWRTRLLRSNFELSVLKNRSRRPHRSPGKTNTETEEELLSIRTESGHCGGIIVSFIYKEKTGKSIAHSTCDKIFSRKGVVCRRRIKPNLHNKRYASSRPLERVQFDTLWLGLEDDHGNRVYSVNAVDCCSRYAFSWTSDSKGSDAAVDALGSFLRTVGTPELIQTDNGVEFTARFTSELNHKRNKPAKLAPFESILRDAGIPHYLIRPRKPQLNGKVERFNQTLLRWVTAAKLNGKPILQIDQAVQRFIIWYNYKRPHSALNGLPPAAAYPNLPGSRAA